MTIFCNTKTINVDAFIKAFSNKDFDQKITIDAERKVKDYAFVITIEDKLRNVINKRLSQANFIFRAVLKPLAGYFVAPMLIAERSNDKIELAISFEKFVTQYRTKITENLDFKFFFKDKQFGIINPSFAQFIGNLAQLKTSMVRHMSSSDAGKVKGAMENAIAYIALAAAQQYKKTAGQIVARGEVWQTLRGLVGLKEKFSSITSGQLQTAIKQAFDGAIVEIALKTAECYKGQTKEIVKEEKGVTNALVVLEDVKQSASKIESAGKEIVIQALGEVSNKIKESRDNYLVHLFEERINNFALNRAGLSSQTRVKADDFYKQLSKAGFFGFNSFFKIIKTDPKSDVYEVHILSKPYKLTKTTPTDPAEKIALIANLANMLKVDEKFIRQSRFNVEGMLKNLVVLESKIKKNTTQDQAAIIEREFVKIYRCLKADKLYIELDRSGDWTQRIKRVTGGVLGFGFKNGYRLIKGTLYYGFQPLKWVGLNLIKGSAKTPNSANVQTLATN